MNVRAKLQCMTVTDNMSEDSVNPVKYGENVSFMAQYSDSPEDNTFSAATPSANMDMFVSNPELYGQFEAGKSYYFDITPCA